MTDLHEGGCLCGDDRYRVRGQPLEAIVCHCTFCQRRTGTAFGVELFFPAENIEFTGGVPKTFEHRNESGRWLRLDFCGHCGTTIGMTAERRPGQRVLMEARLTTAPGTPSTGTFGPKKW